jgi:hypothetical protein
VATSADLTVGCSASLRKVSAHQTSTGRGHSCGGPDAPSRHLLRCCRASFVCASCGCPRASRCSDFNYLPAYICTMLRPCVYVQRHSVHVMPAFWNAQLFKSRLAGCGVRELLSSLCFHPFSSKLASFIALTSASNEDYGCRR